MQRITPHVDIYTEDESGIAFSILHLQSGFACLEPNDHSAYVRHVRACLENEMFEMVDVGCSIISD